MTQIKHYKLSPRRLIIDLLRISSTGSISVKDLLQAAEVFAFSESSVRVTITRLVREGLIESVDRGVYKLNDTSTPLTHFVQQWRKGEHRVKDWDGQWITVHLPKKPNQNDRKNSLKALEFFGLREGLDGIWIRPNNLSMTLVDFRKILTELRLESDANCFLASDFNEALETRCCKDLWPCAEYEERYREAISSLENSSKTITKLSLKDALLETFINGSKAIHLIATDPMLPKEIMPTENRRQLWQTMLAYDDLGRAIWSKFIGELADSPSVTERALSVKAISTSNTSTPSIRRVK